MSEHLPHVSVGSRSETLLALHGLGGTKRQPIDLFTPTVVERFRVVAPDLRAHGDNANSVAPELLTFRQMAEDVKDFITRRKFPGALTVAGISMGAGVALELLTMDVEISRVVLLRPAWGLSGQPPNLDSFPFIAELLETQSPNDGALEFQRSPLYSSIANVSLAAAQALVAQFNQPMARERCERLRRIPADCPTLPAAASDVTVVAAPGDPIHPLTIARVLSDALGAKYLEVSARYDRPEDHRRDVSNILCEL